MEKDVQVAELDTATNEHALMGRFGTRAAIVAGSSGALIAVPAVAFAEEPVPGESVSGTISSAIGELTASIPLVAAVGIGIGATILAFTVGWRLLKRFAR